MSPWIAVQDTSLAARRANGTGRADSHAIYHDRCQRTGDSWKLTERVSEVRYHDQAPLAGPGRRPS